MSRNESWHYPENHMLSSGPGYQIYHIWAWIKEPTIFRRHFQIHFWEKHFLHFDSNCDKICPRWSANSQPLLVQMMAWHRTGDKPLSKPLLCLYSRSDNMPCRQISWSLEAARLDFSHKTSFIHSCTFWQCIINKVLGRITLFINNCTLFGQIFYTYQRRSRCRYNAVIFQFPHTWHPLTRRLWPATGCLVRLDPCFHSAPAPGHMQYYVTLDHVITAPCSIATTQILTYMDTHL